MLKPTAAMTAIACSGALALGVLVAPPASAYPPGKVQRTELNKTSIREGGRFKAQVSNAQPGCRVTFEMVNQRGKVVDTRSGTVGSNGRAQREFSGDTPRKPGEYKVRSIVSGRGCAEEKSRATITVRRG